MSDAERLTAVEALLSNWDTGIAALLPAAATMTDAPRLDGSLATLIGCADDLRAALEDRP